MTPTETAALLRRYNEWRRGNLEGLPQPDPREIGEAIDAAIEMIERLEEAESDTLEQARLNGIGSEREAALMAKLEAAEKERDEFKRACFGHISDNSMLRAKITEMEKQKPVGKFAQHPSNGLWEQDGYGDNPDARLLYALPGAQTQGEEK